MKSVPLFILIFLSVLLLAVNSGGVGCNGQQSKPEDGEATENNGPDSKQDKYEKQRESMVKRQIEARGVKDALVLKAMRKVPRHEFVPENVKHMAYADHPLPIGLDQTISQPYIVAFMTEALKIKPGDKVLEIGTGSGYQAAVLGEITENVYSIEIICELEKRAKKDLDRLGYKDVVTKCGDGYQGWTEEAPFDAVIVTAAPDHVPQPLIDQLKVGGRLVIPVGAYFQELIRITKTKDGKKEERLLGVRFVPMTGEAEKKKR
jgi:protein-L-isoaspartate(D-aspartate) O-methyltransferase